jgi:hypothetical protein
MHIVAANLIIIDTSALKYLLDEQHITCQTVGISYLPTDLLFACYAVQYP